MTDPFRIPGNGRAFGPGLDRLRHRRGWIMALGALCAVLGLVALVLTETATIASVVVIGTFMILAGIVEIGIGIRTRSVGRMILWEIAGFFYIVAGVTAVSTPAQASVWLTLALGAGLIATGLIRILLGARMSGTPTRGAVVTSGLVTALIGLLIVVGWPGNSVIVLGTFLGVDLLLYGITWIVFASRLGTMGG